MEGLAFVVVELILAAIGWACLLIRYGRIDRVQKVLDEKYAGSAAAAARIFILNVFAGTGAVVMIIAVIYVIVFWIINSVTNK